jgi:hypothetical protein
LIDCWVFTAHTFTTSSSIRRAVYYYVQTWGTWTRRGNFYILLIPLSSLLASVNTPQFAFPEPLRLQSGYWSSRLCCRQTIPTVRVHQVADIRDSHPALKAQIRASPPRLHRYRLPDCPKTSQSSHKVTSEKLMFRLRRLHLHRTSHPLIRKMAQT